MLTVYGVLYVVIKPGQQKEKKNALAFLSPCDKLHDANNQENQHMFKRGRSSILTWENTKNVKMEATV